jgi:hypothetical protein
VVLVLLQHQVERVLLAQQTLVVAVAHLLLLVVLALFMFVSATTHKEKLCRSISHN